MVTLKYSNVYLNDWFSIASPDEEKGNIKNVNLYMKDYYYGEKTAEEAEIKMQKTVLNHLLQKYSFPLVIGGDLSNQLATMNTTLKCFDKSFLGIYNACSTFIEGMIIASQYIDAKSIDTACVLTSSHILASERQFRFPNEYGSLKSCYTTVTITAAVGGVLSNQASKYKVVSSTIGNVVDYGVKDVNNIGAIMAPAAAKVFYEHMKNSGKTLDDYDFVLTGDLGRLGLELFLHLLKTEYGIHEEEKFMDAGASIYKENQKKLQGGSGPSVIPFVLFNKVLTSKKVKKVLVIGTGALHNPTLVNQKKSIPAIAHAIEIEVLK